MRMFIFVSLMILTGALAANSPPQHHAPTGQNFNEMKHEYQANPSEQSQVNARINSKNEGLQQGNEFHEAPIRVIQGQ